MSTPWECFRQAARLGEPERVPVALIVDSPWLPGYAGIDTRDYFLLPDRWLTINLGLLERFPDAIWIPGFWVEYGMAAEPSAFGAQVHFYADRPPAIEPVVSDLEFWAGAKPADPQQDGLMPLVLRLYEVMEERLQAEGLGIRMVAARGPLTVASWLMGVTPLMMGLATRPDLVSSLLETMTTTILRWLHAQLETLRQPEGILLLDDLVGMVSRRHYEALIHPHLRRIFDAFEGLIRVYHNDTPCLHLTASLAEAGFDVFNFGHDMDIAEVKARMGNRVALMGNVPPLDVGVRGTPAEVRQRARECLDRGAAGGGMILSFGGGVSPGTPPENIDALLQAAREWSNEHKWCGNEKDMATLLIQNGYVLTMDTEATIHAPGWVWIEGDRIRAVGPGEPSSYLSAAVDRVIDAAHMAVLPGLVNGHTHLSQTFMRGLADGRPLLAWLKGVIWPLQAAMTPDDMRLASLLGLVENLRCGVTSVVQHHKIATTPAHVDAAAEAAAQVGVRMLLARGWVDLGDAGEPPDQIVAEMERLRERWHGAADGRLTVGFGPLAPWRCSDETMRRAVALAREWGVPTHLHVAETQDEIDLLRGRTGLRHVEWLHSLDTLGPDVQLVHSVWLDDAELDLIAASGAVVVHCPVSNMYLASGVARVRDMLDRGIPVALGSDGPASEDSQDMLEALKVAALLAKVSSGDPNALLLLDVLRMATTDGVRLLGRDDVGRIVPGAKADLTLVNLDNARCMPVHTPESALVYSASGPDVHTVIVDGRILLDRGRVTMLDEAALLAECRHAAGRLLQRAGVSPGLGKGQDA